MSIPNVDALDIQELLPETQNSGTHEPLQGDVVPGYPRQDWCTVREAAEICGRSPSTIRRRLAKLGLETVQVPGRGYIKRTLIPRSELPRLVDSTGAVIAAE
jgi:hypothetical protein